MHTGAVTKASRSKPCGKHAGCPPRDVRDVATRAASVIVLDSEPPPADDPDVVWRKVSDKLMNHLLIQRRLDLTAPMLKKLKFKNVPNLSKEHLIILSIP